MLLSITFSGCPSLNTHTHTQRPRETIQITPSENFLPGDEEEKKPDKTSPQSPRLSACPVDLWAMGHRPLASSVPLTHDGEAAGGTGVDVASGTRRAPGRGVGQRAHPHAVRTSHPLKGDLRCIPCPGTRTPRPSW